MSYNKLVKVKVKLPSGEERFLVFRPINAPRDCTVCEICPYDKYCEHIPDPEKPDDKEQSFQDFCGRVDQTLYNAAEKGQEFVSDVIPVDGTIEENLSDVLELNQALIKKNPLVPLHKVIDTVCKDWCDKYEPSYCNCTADNASCLLCSLFKNPKKEFPKQEEEGIIYEEKKEDDGTSTNSIDPGNSTTGTTPITI